VNQFPAIPQPPCLPQAIERITARFDPVRIILFGSWSRGNAQPDSDLDLLIVLSKIKNKRHATIEVLRALNGLPVSKDIVVTTPEEIETRGDQIGLVLRPALHEGIVIYKRP